MSNTRTVLTWIDLETTGLRPPSDHRILEYAIVFTDLELNELASLTAVIPQNVGVAKAMMDNYVFEMHSGNGLLEELDSFPWKYDAIQYADSIEAAEKNIMRMLKSVADDVTDHDVDVIFVVAGSTIGFDKSYIEVFMPTLFEQLHYRQLDVSGHKVGFPELFDSNVRSAHRAMADIRASIAVQAKMRELLGYTVLSHGE